jgi:hypothetical protein
MDILFGELHEHYLLRHGQRVRIFPLGRVDNGKSVDVNHVHSPCKLLTCFDCLQESLILFEGVITSRWFLCRSTILASLT